MKTIFMLCVIAGMICFTSCKKCETCTQTITTSIDQGSAPGYPQTTTSTFEACDDELAKVDGKTVTSHEYRYVGVGYNNIWVTITTYTTCK